MYLSESRFGEGTSRNHVLWGKQDFGVTSQLQYRIHGSVKYHNKFRVARFFISKDRAFSSRGNLALLIVDAAAAAPRFSSPLYNITHLVARGLWLTASRKLDSVGHYYTTSDSCNITYYFYNGGDPISPCYHGIQLSCHYYCFGAHTFRYKSLRNSSYISNYITAIN